MGFSVSFRAGFGTAVRSYHTHKLLIDVIIESCDGRFPLLCTNLIPLYVAIFNYHFEECVGYNPSNSSSVSYIYITDVDGSLAYAGTNFSVLFADLAPGFLHRMLLKGEIPYPKQFFKPSFLAEFTRLSEDERVQTMREIVIACYGF